MGVAWQACRTSETRASGPGGETLLEVEAISMQRSQERGQPPQSCSASLCSAGSSLHSSGSRSQSREFQVCAHLGLSVTALTGGADQTSLLSLPGGCNGMAFLCLPNVHPFHFPCQFGLGPYLYCVIQEKVPQVLG